MNLLKKNTRFLLIYLPIVLGVCSVIFYALLCMQINHLHEVQLLLKRGNVINNLKINYKGDLDLNHAVAGVYSFDKIKPASAVFYNQLRDTMVYSSIRNKILPYRKITSSFEHNGKSYEITTYSSSLETTHLLIAVFGIHLIIYIILLVSIVIINRGVSKKIWQPFYATLHELNTYDISKNMGMNLQEETKVTEFNDLNRAVKQLISRDHQAYQSQKQFVENASHEIQTPLAIIRSKIDLLIQQPDLNEKTAELINDIAEANTRLSNLNKTLLLLAKIDNKQFIEQGSINLSEIIENHLSNLSKYFSERMPRIEKELDPSFSVNANQTLMEVFFYNLIKNAIVHNVPSGKIYLVLKDDVFTIENTGPELKSSPELLFERFRKDSDKVNNSGLGLAIVKQIALLYQFKVDYQHHHLLHTIRVQF